MSEQVAVADLVVAFLEACGVETIFGVISIHNLPVTDALVRRKKIGFVPTRNEAGAVNMADSGARLSNRLGVALTSTGAGAANACAALLECQAAGTPLLHITGNVEMKYIDRITGYTHEAPNQFRLLEGASKAAFRVQAPETAFGTLREAVRVALTAPMGPVSLEIPIDVQRMMVELPALIEPLPVPVAEPSAAAVEAVAALLLKAQRPMLWLGGGAREAAEACRRLAEAGVGIASSVQGRGIVPDDHPMNLCSFTTQAASSAFFKSCDFMLVAGSKLRSAQTKDYAVPLPRPLVVLDADPRAENRNYRADSFVCADAPHFLAALADKVVGRLRLDPAFAADVGEARRAAEGELRRTLGPYEKLLDAVAKAAPADFNWVRDITMNNSLWGNRLPALRVPRRSLYAVSGGIGMGLAQSIGAALAKPRRKTIALIGDGGFVLSMGEIATAVQEKADLTILLMNDGGYGIMRNLQDAQFGGRRFAADLLMPDFGLLAQSLGIPFRKVTDASQFEGTVREMVALEGPSLVECDMLSIGDFATRFHGPPTPHSRAMEKA